MRSFALVFVLAYYEENREHLEPWEPARTPEFYSLAHLEDRLRRNRDDVDRDRGLRLFLLRRPEAEDEEPQDVIGSCNFTEVVRGPFQCCTLGFGLAAKHEGKGYMREALEASIAYVFEELGVHRIEAAYQPHNQRSGGLLRRLGFTVEGFARDYLHLAGAWRDHVLTSKTNPSW